MTRLCRVTAELLEDGVVTFAHIHTAENDDWAGAVAAALDWQRSDVLVRLLHDRMEEIFLSCEKPNDLEKYDTWLAAARIIISSLPSETQRSLKDVDVYREWEADIRSGKAFE